MRIGKGRRMEGGGRESRELRKEGKAKGKREAWKG